MDPNALSDGTVTLRPPTEDDAETMASLAQRCYQHLAPWMVWAKPDYSVDDALFWIRRGDDETSHPFLVLDESGTAVGSAGLNGFSAQNSLANLGYWIAPDAQGEGIATRATNLLLRYAIEQVGLNRVEIWMSTENAPSQAVAERSWATYEGTLRQNLLLNGRAHDSHCYGFVASELPD